MTDYEYVLKERYQADGYYFLYDVIAESNRGINWRIARQYDLSPNNVFSVQGDCVYFDIERGIGTSRWLIFIKMRRCA